MLAFPLHAVANQNFNLTYGWVPYPHKKKMGIVEQKKDAYCRMTLQMLLQLSDKLTN